MRNYAVAFEFFILLHERKEPFALLISLPHVLPCPPQMRSKPRCICISPPLFNFCIFRCSSQLWGVFQLLISFDEAMPLLFFYFVYNSKLNFCHFFIYCYKKYFLRLFSLLIRMLLPVHLIWKRLFFCWGHLYFSAIDYAAHHTFSKETYRLVFTLLFCLMTLVLPVLLSPAARILHQLLIPYMGRYKGGNFLFV